jgi:penicillin-binding protein 1C
LIEAATALRLEQLWTKERILTEYLNRVDFGHLNVGLAAAADYYLGKPLPISPMRKPLPRRVAEKSDTVESAPCAQCDTGSAARSAEADARQRLDQPGRLRSRHCRGAARTTATTAISGTSFRRSPAPLRGGGGVVRTTLDLKLNDRVELLLHEQIAQLRSLNVTNGAVVVIDNSNSDVIALVGSEDFFAAGAGSSTARPLAAHPARRSSLSPICLPSNAGRQPRQFTPTYRQNFQRARETTGWTTTNVAAADP